MSSSSAFSIWFGRSVVVDDDGNPKRCFHGTKHDIFNFDSTLTKDKCFHFGTPEQANDRVSGDGKNIVPVYLSIENPRRSKDMGGDWKKKIASAKSAGFDGIVYLNRYEGIGRETVERAFAEGLDLDKLSDKDFKRYAPEARDSYIAFDTKQIKSAVSSFDCVNRKNSDLDNRLYSSAEMAMHFLSGLEEKPKFSLSPS